METVNHNRYLGEENISKLLWKFAVPCVASLLIGALYNIIDQIFIGNSELGFLGNAATGISFPVICIVNAFAWCIGDGAAAYLSICAGRNDSQSAHKTVGTGLTVSLIISILLTIICEVFCVQLMKLFGASVNTLDYAVEYFRIIAAFLPFYLLSNVMNGMIRSDGAPAVAMITLATGAIFNIFLDPLFIFGFKWGMAGAAWATVIGQVISFVLSSLYFFKPKSFKLHKESFVPDMKILKIATKMGASVFITQISLVIIQSVSNLVLFHYGSLSIYGPDIPISVFSVQNKVFAVVINIVVGIALGAQPIFGYNYGANKLQRVKDLFKLEMKAILAVSICAFLIFEFAPMLIINLFGSGNELYIDFALKSFRIYLSLIVVTCLIKMVAIFFQAIGKPFNAAITSMVRDLICFVPLTIILSIVFESLEAGKGIYGILIAAPIADCIAAFIAAFVTIKFFKSQKSAEEIDKTECCIQKSHEGPIIAISRMHGSGGKETGRILAEHLNVPFYYKEVVALAAKNSGMSSSFIADIEDNQDMFYDLYLSTSIVQDAITAQDQVLNHIADAGSSVIVGRAADYVLRNRDNLISIYIYADDEYRVERISEIYGDSVEEAKRYIKKSDIARSGYYENISGNKWGQFENYDLCIDASIGIEKTVAIIEEYIKNRQK